MVPGQEKAAQLVKDIDREIKPILYDCFGHDRKLSGCDERTILLLRAIQRRIQVVFGLPITVKITASKEGT